MNHIDTGIKRAAGTWSVLWCRWLLDVGSCNLTHPAVRGKHYSFMQKSINTIHHPQHSPSNCPPPPPPPPRPPPPLTPPPPPPLPNANHITIPKENICIRLRAVHEFPKLIEALGNSQDDGPSPPTPNSSPIPPHPKCKWQNYPQRKENICIWLRSVHDFPMYFKNCLRPLAIHRMMALAPPPPPPPPPPPDHHPHHPQPPPQPPQKKSNKMHS